MDTTFIYALRESDTGEIRYVGKSNDPERRLKEHFEDLIHSYKQSWIKALLERGAWPTLELLFECPKSEWQRWEQLAIQLFLKTGCRLVNLTLGGEGGIGGPNFRGHRHSSESKLRTSAALKGRPSPTKGVPHTLETRRKMRGKVLSPEHRRKISESGKRRYAKNLS